MNKSYIFSPVTIFIKWALVLGPYIFDKSPERAINRANSHCKNNVVSWLKS